MFAGAPGTCTVTATNSGFSAQAAVTVRGFTPTPLASLPLPGFANNVDVSGRYAYVAAGSAGLRVVDAGNPKAPAIVGSRDTPGNANDVRVVGTRAYVADGSAGLQVVDVANPAAPAIVAALDTPGDAQDVAVRGALVYVADGGSGLQIIDVSLPHLPRLMGGIDTPGLAKGVDILPLSGLVAIADGTSGLQLVDASDPRRPVLRGRISTGGDTRDVAVRGDFAYVADFAGSFTVVDISDPAAPVVRASTPQSLGGRLMDVDLAGDFAFGADVLFVNGVPIIAVEDPVRPAVRAILDFRAFRDDNGTGIAADGSLLYLTAATTITENGASGDTRLYIGQYLSGQDLEGVPPSASIVAPAPGTVVEGTTLPIEVEADDDVTVVAVELLANEQAVFTDTTEPYQFALTVPTGITSLTLGARAIDAGGRAGAAQEVVLAVTPDPRTTVVGRVVDEALRPIAGALVETFGATATTAGDGLFSLTGVPTIRGPVEVSAEALIGGERLTGRSRTVEPVPNGETAVGDVIVRRPLPGDGLLVRFFDTPFPVDALRNGFADLKPQPFDVTTAAGTKSVTSYVVPVVNFPDGPFDVVSFFNVGPDGVHDPNSTASAPRGDDIRILPPSGNDTFGAQFSGYLLVPQGGEVTFRVGVDDAFQLIVGGNVVAQFLGLTDFRYVQGTVTLPAGYVPIVLRYGEQEGEADLVLEAQGGGLPGGPIPRELLFSTLSGAP